MMMVVTDSILVESGRACGLDAPNETLLRQNSERIVNGLAGYGANAVPYMLGDIVGRTMGPLGNCSKDGQSLGGHLDAVFTKQVGWIRHPGSILNILD
jgi:hypothetical protein